MAAGMVKTMTNAACSSHRILLLRLQRHMASSAKRNIIKKMRVSGIKSTEEEMMLATNSIGWR
jgi:hypothetical protein